MDSISSAAVLARIGGPATLLFIATAFGLWRARNRRWAYRLALSSFACLFAIATPVGTRALLLPLGHTPALTHAQIIALPKKNAVLVVLTGGKQRAAEYPEGETLSAASLER